MAAFFSPGDAGAAVLCLSLFLSAQGCMASGGFGVGFHWGPPTRGEVFLRLLGLALFVAAALASVLAWTSHPVALPFKSIHV
jgi:hypothetical protein